MEDLILRSLTGEVTVAEKKLLVRWRNESSENERVYQEFAHAWHALPLHTSQDPVSAVPPLGEIVRAGNERRRKAIPLRGLPHRSSSFRTRSLIAAAAATVALLFGIKVLQLGPPDVIHATRANEIRTVQLADGSIVRLGPESSLGVWSGRSRRAEFSGVGFFAISTDSTSPFIVTTDAGTAEVLGTRFELRAQNDSLRLIIVEGTVVLAAAGNRVEVARGEMASIDCDGAPTVPLAVDVWSELDWGNGLLVFRDTRLADVADELERFFGVAISIQDSTLSARAVTAWFGDEPFEQVAETICQTVGAECLLGDSLEIRP